MQQLALLATSDIFPNLKPGDRVKLRRQTVNAPQWKRGDIVRVEVVHPVDGSVKCWNKRVQNWGYLYPDEFTPVPPPLDSVSKPIAPDTESNCPHSETDTIARVETDTESNCQPVEIDSVSIAPPADTESTPEPVELDSVSGPVHRYRPKGTARGGEYFRFSYRAGGKMKHLHIPGGNTGSVLAQSRAAEVMDFAAAGVPLQDLIDLVKSWSGKIT